MRIINFDKTYNLFDGDNVDILEKLPVQTYRVVFNKQTGFSLESTDDLVFDKDEKVYGNSTQKVEKVFKRYKSLTTSLGIMLSGEKGIGKTLFVRQLSDKALELGIPVILVSDAYLGISSFLSKLKQETLIIFDEFEKVFPNNEEQTDREPQSKLLGLFDGTGTQKHIFAITVNHLYRVNEFFINRPGRFHFHIRFSFPTSDEITEYMTDKLLEFDENIIKSVISLSVRQPLNFDCLNAIVFELNQGETLQSALEDLNITRETVKRDVTFVYDDGSSHMIKYDLSLEKEVHLDTYLEEVGDVVIIKFNLDDAIIKDGKYIAGADILEITYEDGEKAARKKVKSVIIANTRNDKIGLLV